MAVSGTTKVTLRSRLRKLEMTLQESIQIVDEAIIMA